LPFPLQISWRKTVDIFEQSSKDVTFNELVNFIDREARIAKHPVFSSEALAEAEGKNKAADTKPSVSKASNPRFKAAYTAKVQATKAGEFPDAKSDEYLDEPTVQISLRRECMCAKSHDLDSCDVFPSRPVEERKAFLIKNRLCFGCYGHTSKTHDVRTCHKRRKCKICGKLHATGLHGLLSKKQPDSAAAGNETQVKTVTSCATAVPRDAGIAMSLVMVRLTSGDNPDNSLLVYAALDNMSSACFISKDVWQRLGSPGNPAEITVKTMNEERRHDTIVVNNLYVSSVADSNPIRLPKVFTQDTLPIDVSETPSHRIIANYPHLRHLTAEIPDRDETIPVGLLIGVNCPKALEPRGFIKSVDNGPFAVKTFLGWCVSGPLRSDDGRYADQVLSCNRTGVSKPRLLVQENDLQDMMLKMYESEFNESTSNLLCQNCLPHGRNDHKCDAKVSQDDLKFLTKMDSESKIVEGHYELPLPFRQQDVSMPNNRTQALKRAEGIKRRFTSNAKYKEDYSKFMKDIIERGYVNKVSDNSDTARIGENCWYIPHHGVYHPKKPDKIRVVFDCSARYAGRSLNDELLQGPNLANSLVGVLVRFRQESIAIAADVECMFYQVKLPHSDRNYLRFLWWPDGNTNLELQDYEMCVHPFGAASSPSCANFALKRTADDNEKQFGSKAADTLRRNF
jgi:hypothetical protein